MNLKQLADLLELSPTTVSRALNGYPEVSEDTRRRVLAAAEAHHYSPNLRARSLATGRAMAIGHVIPVSTSHEIMNPVFADFIAGASEAYGKAGYDLHLTLIPDADQARIYRELGSRRAVDGVIVHSPGRGDARIAMLRASGLPFVVHGRATGEAAPYSWVDVNNRRAFERAAGHLCDLGHRRIALVNGLETLDFARRRREGFAVALAAHDVAPDPALMSSDEMTETNGYRAARAMLDEADPPTAFLVSSIISGTGVRRAVEERGLVTGRDVSIVIHDDDLSYFRNSDPAGEALFTATRSSVRLAGRLAAEMLLQLIARPESGPLTRLLEAELIVGRTTCAPRNPQKIGSR
ncbi:substrate-binding domain-containing protein [Acidimangrovimonas sediminis]|uniref:substrate-binding domain-containing protein n=1 Tax=Acidimangrovimonas sediminis TaxID=2056283 RepID=UPI000C80F1C9|nr:substrate-binding domain-containing protein [Acidimangrovimonas sediminis]